MLLKNHTQLGSSFVNGYYHNPQPGVIGVIPMFHQLT